LLNQDYKILSKTLAIRFESVIEKIISKDQTGFIKNRFIGENIAKSLSIIDLCNKENIKGLLLSVDMEKAFDFLNWNCIQKSLKFFNFPDYITRWVEILYTDINSRVFNNGHLSEPFNIGRSVRQGCGLSPYLFVICTEFFAISIRKNDKIKGIKCKNSEFKISQYADDTSLTLMAEPETLKETLKTLEEFEKCSGLKVNMRKTQVLRLGSLRNSAFVLDVGKNLMWTNDPITLSRSEISVNLETIPEINYANIIKKLESILNVWEYRNLSLLGRICIVNTLAVSKLLFHFSSIESPSPKQCQSINNAIYNFVWKGKPDKIKRIVISAPISVGGTNLVSVEAKYKSLKVAWIKRMISNPDWIDLIEKYTFIPVKLIVNGNINLKDLHLYINPKLYIFIGLNLILRMTIRMKNFLNKKYF